MTTHPESIVQGFSGPPEPRLTLPDSADMNEEQRTQAEALVNGPRKGVKGPFIPLMHSPVLLKHLARTGEYLRFQSSIAEALKELAALIVARETSNQFEWAVHYPLALAAGVSAETLSELYQGARPQNLAPDEAVVYDFARELISRHGVSDAIYRRAADSLGPGGLVDLTALIGYFHVVCWIMNVAKTPSDVSAQTGPLGAFPC